MVCETELHNNPPNHVYLNDYIYLHHLIISYLDFIDLQLT